MKISHSFIFILFFSLYCKAGLINEKNSNFSFIGHDYTIYIKSNCENTINCNNVTARFIYKNKSHGVYMKNGNTINVGYGDNLRGFTFYNKGLEYTIRQQTESDAVDLSKWVFIIHEKGKIYSDDELNKSKFHEFGDFEFLSSS